MIPTDWCCEIRIRSIIVPNKTIKPNSERTIHVAIAPEVNPFCPFGGSFEHTRLFSVTLVLLKSILIKEATDSRLHDDGTQRPRVIPRDAVAFGFDDFGKSVPKTTLSFALQSYIKINILTILCIEWLWHKWFIIGYIHFL